MGGILLLEDGRSFEGEAFGARATRVGEIVFNTAMSGYQEVLTDPSYCEQIVVMTHYFDGYSTSEIAHMLGHPVGTVTKRLQRARTRLRKRLRSDDL